MVHADLVQKVLKVELYLLHQQLLQLWYRDLEFCRDALGCERTCVISIDIVYYGISDAFLFDMTDVLHLLVCRPVLTDAVAHPCGKHF